MQLMTRRSKQWMQHNQVGIYAVGVLLALVELTGMVVLTRVVPAWLVPDSPERPPDSDIGRRR